MPVHPVKAAQILKNQKKAYKLWKSGLTTREVGAIMKKSHEWVAIAVRKLSTEKT